MHQLFLLFTNHGCVRIRLLRHVLEIVHRAQVVTALHHFERISLTIQRLQVVECLAFTRAGALAIAQDHVHAKVLS